MARGPTQAARRNAKKLADMAQRMQIQVPALRATARQILAVTKEAYAAEKEPWGRGWRKLRYRTPPPPPLQLTLASKNSIKCTAHLKGITFYAADYLYYHMSGYVNSAALRKRAGKRKRAGASLDSTPMVAKRNPTPFNFENGKWVFKKQLVKAHEKRLKAWISKGVVLEA